MCRVKTMKTNGEIWWKREAVSDRTLSDQCRAESLSLAPQHTVLNSNSVFHLFLKRSHPFPYPQDCRRRQDSIRVGICFPVPRTMSDVSKWELKNLNSYPIKAQSQNLESKYLALSPATDWISYLDILLPVQKSYSQWYMGVAVHISKLKHSASQYHEHQQHYHHHITITISSIPPL